MYWAQRLQASWLSPPIAVLLFKDVDAQPTNDEEQEPQAQAARAVVDGKEAQELG